MGTRVYVGRLPPRAYEKDLERFFRGYGRITEILLKNGYAFVEFADSRDAEDAIYERNGGTILGERVTVEMAKSRPRRREMIRERYRYRSRSRDRRRSRSRDRRTRRRSRSHESKRKRKYSSSSESDDIDRKRSASRSLSPKNLKSESKKKRDGSESSRSSSPDSRRGKFKSSKKRDKKKDRSSDMDDQDEEMFEKTHNVVVTGFKSSSKIEKTFTTELPSSSSSSSSPSIPFIIDSLRLSFITLRISRIFASRHTSLHMLRDTLRSPIRIL